MTLFRFLQILTCIGALLTAGSSFLFYQKKTAFSHEMLLASNTYLGPTKPVQGNPQLIRVEVLIQDSADPAGPQVISVELNKTNIPLKPRDINGNRGSGSFRLPPGKYKLRWVTNQNKIAWPRKVSHEEEVTLSPRDLWIQIQIEGDSAAIS